MRYITYNVHDSKEFGFFVWSYDKLLYLRSQTPIVSRIECMDNDGHPISIARIPVDELIRGPLKRNEKIEIDVRKREKREVNAHAIVDFYPTHQLLIPLARGRITRYRKNRKTQ